MANPGPQVENGYTRIANEVLEAIYSADLNSTQLKIVLAVIRYTYGFNRKEHNMSLSFISKATGITRRYVSTELSRLIERRIILITKEHTDTSSRMLKFNKHYEQWYGTDVQQVKKTTTDDEPDTTTGEDVFYTGGDESFHQERQLKDKYKDKGGNDFKSIFDFYMTLDLIKHRTYTKDMTKAIKRAMDNNKYSIEYCKELLKRHKEVVGLSKGQQYPVRARGISEFFGQKVYQGSHLICSEYDEGGKYYEQYLRGKQTKPKEPVPFRYVPYEI